MSTACEIAQLFSHSRLILNNAEERYCLGDYDQAQAFAVEAYESLDELISLVEAVIESRP